jgi:hypothetical protein
MKRGRMLNMAKMKSDCYCAHCERATILKGTPYCICSIHGPVEATFGCSHYILDVFKVPVTPPAPFQSEEMEV